MREIDDPLLQVPPACRGNRDVRGSVPLAKRGEQTCAPHGSPREAGGTSKEGGN